MAISALQAAYILCEASDWSINNLQLHKLLYIFNMIYAGRYGVPLIEERFEAWDYGPVLPGLYNRTKMYGNKPIKHISGYRERTEAPEEIRMFIVRMWHAFKDKSSSELVAITHRENGAWDKNYQSGISIPIPLEHIIEEYNQRIKEHIG